MSVREAGSIIRGKENFPTYRVELQVGIGTRGEGGRWGQVEGHLPPESPDQPPLRIVVLYRDERMERGPLAILNQNARLEAKKRKLPRLVVKSGKGETFFSRLRRAPSAIIRR